MCGFHLCLRALQDLFAFLFRKGGENQTSRPSGKEAAAKKPCLLALPPLSRSARLPWESSVVLKGANMATVPVYCICRLPYDVTRFMIECDACKDWFHGR